MSGLRFKRADRSDFGELINLSLGEIAEYRKSRRVAQEVVYVSTEDLLKDFSGITKRKLPEAEGIEFFKGDILLGNIRPYLKKIWLADCQGVCSADVLVIRSKSIDPSCLFYMLSSERFFHHISDGYKGSKMPRGDKKQILEYKLTIPEEIEEQQKIATFFTVLDEKISITRKKIYNIQKANNKLIADVLGGDTRFLPTNGQHFHDWKCERLGKSFSVKMCKRIFKEETSDKGDIPFYKIGTFGGRADSYITNEQFESYKNKYSYPSKGDTLISCSGTVGRCVVFDGSPSYFQDSNIVWLEPNDKNFKYDKFYLTSVLENLRWDNLSSSTIKRIYSKDLLEKEWFIPCLDEQRIIAEFISILTRKLAIENEKLASLTKLKMAFMQQMFV